MALSYSPRSPVLLPTVVASVALVAGLITPSAARATTLASADFATYANGDLVGQNGWQQYNTPTTAPIQVAGGRVTWTGNGVTSANNQDAMLSFGQVIPQPSVGSTVLEFDLLLSVASAGASPSYFAALNTLDTTSTSGNFQNARLVAQSSGAGYVFGARVNGQSGYPFAYGTSVLNFGQTYALRAELNLVAGNANDFINLYVGDDFNSLPSTPYATAAYTTGTVADITVGAMLLSQFASSTAFESGVSVQSMGVTQIVPEPSAVALVGVGLAAALVRMRRHLSPPRRPQTAC